MLVESVHVGLACSTRRWEEVQKEAIKQPSSSGVEQIVTGWSVTKSNYSNLNNPKREQGVIVTEEKRKKNHVAEENFY